MINKFLQKQRCVQFGGGGGGGEGGGGGKGGGEGEGGGGGGGVVGVIEGPHEALG